MAKLEVLALNSNQIGDLGMSSLSEALAKGSMANLKKLWLNDNQIGDLGMSSLSEALAKGSMASLAELYVDNPEHPTLKAACETRGIELDSS